MNVGNLWIVLFFLESCSHLDYFLFNYLLLLLLIVSIFTILCYYTILVMFCDRRANLCCSAHSCLLQLLLRESLCDSRSVFKPQKKKRSRNVEEEEASCLYSAWIVGCFQSIPSSPLLGANFDEPTATQVFKGHKNLDPFMCWPHWPR